MARRNPMNERYTSDEKKGTGATRGGATSMKPATRAGASVHTASKKPTTQRGRAMNMVNGNNAKTKEEKKAERAKRREEEDLLYTAGSILVNKDEKYQKWRRVWWVCLIGAVLFTALSWGTLSSGINAVVSIVVLVLAYATIIAALFIDIIPVRKRRNVYRDRVAAMTHKQVESIVRQDYVERQAKDAAKKARRAAKKAGEDPDAAYQKAYEEAAAAAQSGRSSAVDKDKDAKSSEERLPVSDQVKNATAQAQAAAAEEQRQGHRFFGRRKTKEGKATEAAAASTSESAAPQTAEPISEDEVQAAAARKEANERLAREFATSRRSGTGK